MKTITAWQKEEKIRKGVFKYFSLKLLLVSCLFLSSLLIFVRIIHEAVYRNEQAFDNRVFAFFARHTTSQLISIMQYITFFGSSHFLLPAYAILISFFLAQRKYRYSLHIIVIALSSTGSMFALKEITHRHRPLQPIIAGITNYSFPSGHALSSFIFCGILVYSIWHSQLPAFYKWLITVLLLCFAISIGISRIILRVHFPTDVIAGFCLGIIWATMSLWVMRIISRKLPAIEHTAQARISG
jgi:undecaprenyl-diphosphatase